MASTTPRGMSLPRKGQGASPFYPHLAPNRNRDPPRDNSDVLASERASLRRLVLQPLAPVRPRTGTTPQPVKPGADLRCAARAGPGAGAASGSIGWCGHAKCARCVVPFCMP